MGTAGIAITLIILFIVVGGLLPFVQSAFEVDVVTQNLEGIEDDIGEGAGTTNVITLGRVLASVTKMFFWTFGDLPFWLDLFFLLLRILLVVTLIMTFVGIGA